MLDRVNEPKQFAWSYSRLKSFEDCPRRYHETQIKKAWPEESSEMLDFGDAVHKAMAEALKTGNKLPTKFRMFQGWIDKVARTPGELLVEGDAQWAVDRDMKPTTWFSKSVWLRTVADAVKLDLNPADGLPTALVVDWKTGKSLNADPVQLTLTSLMAFLQFPEIQCVRSDFVWLQEDTQSTQVLYKHECPANWQLIMPRVKRLEYATVRDLFPPVPNRFCRKWCPVKSCEYNGK